MRLITSSPTLINAERRSIVILHIRYLYVPDPFALLSRGFDAFYATRLLIRALDMSFITSSCLRTLSEQITWETRERIIASVGVVLECSKTFAVHIRSWPSIQHSKRFISTTISTIISANEYYYAKPAFKHRESTANYINYIPLTVRRTTRHVRTRKVPIMPCD